MNEMIGVLKALCTLINALKKAPKETSILFFQFIIYYYFYYFFSLLFFNHLSKSSKFYLESSD